MNSLPFVTALCPTYCRPRLLENCIACFLAQTYPAARRELLILDDAGQLAPQSGPGWRLFSQQDRFDRLPAKYNALVKSANPETEVFVIFEDDDVYLPHHLESHVSALSRARWSKPSQILSTYTGRPVLESAAGRFFASIALTRDLWFEVGGIPDTARADFDLQFMAGLGRTCGPAADTLDDCKDRIPGYCFRWGSTGAYHGQAQMKSPADEQWYERCRQPVSSMQSVQQVHPELDRESSEIFRLFAAPQSR